MARTPEQKAADEALTEAIERVRRVYDTEAVTAGMTMMEYVVVHAAATWDEEGDGRTSVGVVYRDGDVPIHRAIGLLRHALVEMEDYVRSPE